MEDSGTLTKLPPRDSAGVAPSLPLRTDVDEAAARRSLREQIARLERELAALFTAAHPRKGLEWTVRSPGGPRLLGVGELEALRDDLAARLEDTRQTLGDRTRVERRNVERIEEMVAEPGALQVGPHLERGHRRAGVQALALPPAPRPDRHADGLVAGQDLLRLPMTTGARRPLRDPVPEWPIGAGGAGRTTAAPGRPAEGGARASVRRDSGDVSGGPRRRRPPERPPAPWGRFPLVELVVLLGLGLLVAGLLRPGRPRGDDDRRRRRPGVAGRAGALDPRAPRRLPVPLDRAGGRGRRGGAGGRATSCSRRSSSRSTC